MDFESSSDAAELSFSLSSFGAELSYSSSSFFSQDVHSSSSSSFSTTQHDHRTSTYTSSTISKALAVITDFSPHPTPHPAHIHRPSYKALIVGSVVPSAVFLAALVFFVLIWRRKRRRGPDYNATPLLPHLGFKRWSKTSFSSNTPAAFLGQPNPDAGSPEVEMTSKHTTDNTEQDKAQTRSSRSNNEQVENGIRSQDAAVTSSPSSATISPQLQPRRSHIEQYFGIEQHKQAPSMSDAVQPGKSPTRASIRPVEESEEPHETNGPASSDNVEHSEDKGISSSPPLSDQQWASRVRGRQRAQALSNPDGSSPAQCDSAEEHLRKTATASGQPEEQARYDRAE